MESTSINPEEFHTLDKRTKTILIGVGIFFIFILLPLFSIKYYRFALNRPAQGLKETSFTIKEGETVTTVAERLGDEELVNSEFLFKAYLVSEGLHKKIEAGNYRIPAGASVKQLAEIFQHGTNDQKVTLIEGWRVEQYATELSEIFKNIDYKEFVDLAKSKEGYLFPDTYFFTMEAGEEEIVDRLEATFEEKTQNLITNKVLSDLGMTEDELITFASIVEREISKDEDKEIVAGILINRWRNGQALEADATTQYAVALERFCQNKTDECPTQEEAPLVEWWPNNLTVDELNYEDPYNTRAVAGLPPSPISNPSLSSIEAVINYKDTTYNFYLTDENGITHFSNTLEEHNRNVAEYLY